MNILIVGSDISEVVFNMYKTYKVIRKTQVGDSAYTKFYLQDEDSNLTIIVVNYLYSTTVRGMRFCKIYTTPALFYKYNQILHQLSYGSDRLNIIELVLPHDITS